MQRHAQENGRKGGSGPNAKRKPIRRDMEKRRLQNVKAQRKYREKLRARLDRLEGLAASVTQSHAIEAETVTDAGPSDVTTDSSCSYSASPNTAGMTPLPYAASGTSGSDTSVVTPGECPPGECQYLFPRLEEGEAARSIPDSGARILQPDNTSTALGTWDSTIFVDPSSLLISDKFSGALDPYWTTTINCGCSVAHLQLRTKGAGPSNYEEIRIIKFRPDIATPDPYASSIRIETLCTVSALCTIGMHVGLTEEMVCTDNSLSPFFWPSSGLDLDDDTAKTNTIRTVRKVFSTLKPDLRPSIEQITVPHHPYIDMLPFPTLRNNLIRHQEEVDKDELFHDMITGLVCWGSGGIGKRDRQVSTRPVSTGTPWDARSWEAKVWFLKKYWALLGGEDGELVRQSEWWRSIRGDDTPGIQVHSLSW
ncbi:hypothetical protein EMPG_11680 [Blastomyces silverae]|uniref:BZIP domain-containing protein n=1 Tax=Blastomyces silverae TaxID=2060906 RepID=A0A0H1BPZ6_9EURO|nr:hypothetical protein EMPG_11680 [Blastomyces silverae]